jgi:UDP-3-O-[3-hydroxymyristoyl] glucosamine N-acyltransferase
MSQAALAQPVKQLTLQQLATATKARLQGDDERLISGVATLEQAGPQHISFLANVRYRAQLATTRAGVVIVGASDAALCPTAVLIASNPLLAYAKVAALFQPQPGQNALSGVHASAWVSPDAYIAETAWIGPQCSIEAGVRIAEGVRIGPGCVIERGAVIGRDSHLLAKVTVCRDVVLGQRVLAQPGAVIGSDGFGNANDQGRWVKIHQLGSVRVGDDVEIGANTTIDRGAIDDTVIEDGVKLDNQIQIAHNVHIGAHTAIAGCVGIAGSVKIGRYCMLGGGVGVAGHLEIADRVIVTGMSLVTQSITQAGVYSSGLAVEPNRVWNKISARLRRLDELTRRFIAVEKTVLQKDTKKSC